MSPLSWSTETFKSLPPMFVTNGGIETIKDEGCEFVALAKAQGVPVEHIIMVSQYNPVVEERC
jgi:acetyl esterase/lipase